MDLSQKPFYLNKNQVDWVENKLNSLTIEQKVGQLFCLMGNGYSAEDLHRYVEDYCIGGILFRPATTKSLKIQYEELDRLVQIPLLKAANLEEGGAGAITDGTYFASQIQIAATDNIAMVEKFANVCATESRKIGVNWTFSPVVDIDMNFQNPITNVRTFGSNPEKIYEFASRYIKTIQNTGMAACAKHFPGDGVDYRDQHLHPTYNNLTAEEWYATFGNIYKQLIDEGLLSVMVGHIVQPNLEKQFNPSLKDEDILPASLSCNILTGVLRDKLGFNGVVTTDATIMGGFTMAMERRIAIPTSIAAGADMLVFSTDFEEDYQYLLDGIQDGIVSEERLNDALRRVLALKVKVLELPAMNSIQETSEWQNECADLSVTLVKNKDGIIPLDKWKYRNIRLMTLGKENGPDGPIMDIAEEMLKAEGFKVERYDPVNDHMHGTANLPKDRLTLCMCNLVNASNQTAIRLFWNYRGALQKPNFVHEEDTVFVSLSNPYHLQDVPRVRTYINAYTATKANIAAVINKLLGKSSFKGTSPVDPFCGLIDTKL